jgi:hypothetical protein
VIQLSPPLIADTEQFEEIGEILRSVLTEAWERVEDGTRDGSGRLERRGS